MKKFFIWICGVCMVYFLAFSIIHINASRQVTAYRYGSRGTVVREIQTRLRNWGYYTGAVDGIYGYETYSAVKYFQRKNGLTPDGVAGSRTLAALGVSSSTAVTTGTSYGGQNLYLLARLINGEARGEPFIGQVAVGGVIMNRLRDPRFPKTIPGIIYQPGAFNAVSDGQMWVNLLPSSVKAAQDALNGWDPSGGALYYYNPAKTTNKWIWGRPIIKVIGDHYFCK